MRTEEKTKKHYVAIGTTHKNDKRRRAMGAYLSGEDFCGYDFSLAYLSLANLSGANLSDANLKRVQALQTNFQYAVLTEVCIENWNINAQTNLEEVECRDVYLKTTFGQYIDRLPINNNEFFAPDEFTKLASKSPCLIGGASPH